jgi:hypothetical protein
MSEVKSILISQFDTVIETYERFIDLLSEDEKEDLQKCIKCRQIFNN